MMMKYGQLGRQSPTFTPFVTPNFCSPAAARLARDPSCAYVQRRPMKSIAGRWPKRSTAASSSAPADDVGISKQSAVGRAIGPSISFPPVTPGLPIRSLPAVNVNLTRFQTFCNKNNGAIRPRFPDGLSQKMHATSRWTFLLFGRRRTGAGEGLDSFEVNRSRFATLHRDVERDLLALVQAAKSG